ncbi:hypothetical protein OTC26_003700 [Streptomyces tirandamycinicus]|uniref:hypothetical protein n=1 Tax=Streptomyces tirandamycinicus TaxID=2174846 RepID=UPI002271036C|nr:hypothetical protein [Streptomyces tirandamycinicus]MCY0981639.1 hypothetical protein [Streptomyces tirandamycinicus]
MVRTMSLLRALISTARMVRHTPRLADGLPPDDAVLLDAPDGELGPALVAAALGDHEPAAALLATTRGSAEWENRDRYVMRLAAFAYSRPGWLAGWLADSPHDPDALLVKAELEVRRAWESPARAERLRETGPLVRAAAEADPRDPVPWRLALDHARGVHAGHTAFEALWEQAVRRSSHHYGCHVAALRYLSTVWRGSHRECLDFAERAAEDSLPGSLVQALPARAALTPLLEGAVTAVTADRIDAAADRAAELSARYRPGDPWPAEVRNLLVYVLIARGRWHEALEQFRVIGQHATSFPWNRVTDDPLGQFLEARDGVRIEVASSMPLRRARRIGAAGTAGAGQGRVAGRAVPGDHYA